jgi:hypothetical protein
MSSIFLKACSNIGFGGGGGGDAGCVLMAMKPQARSDVGEIQRHIPAAVLRHRHAGPSWKISSGERAGWVSLGRAGENHGGLTL